MRIGREQRGLKIRQDVGYLFSQVQAFWNNDNLELLADATVVVLIQFGADQSGIPVWAFNHFWR